MMGWNTALERRYEVPVQNASMAVPFKDCVICYRLASARLSNLRSKRGNSLGEPSPRWLRLVPP